MTATRGRDLAISRTMVAHRGPFGEIPMKSSVLALTLPAVFLVASAATASSQRGAPSIERVTELETARPARAPPTRPSTGPTPPSLARTGLPAIVMTGYWPPSNEAIRRFSDDPAQNPLGWIGGDWEGRRSSLLFVWHAHRQVLERQARVVTSHQYVSLLYPLDSNRFQ